MQDRQGGKARPQPIRPVPSRQPRSLAVASSSYHTAVATGVTSESVPLPRVRNYEQHLLYHAANTSFGMPGFLHTPITSQGARAHTPLQHPPALDMAERMSVAREQLWQSGLLHLEGSVHGRVLLKALRKDAGLAGRLKHKYLEMYPQLVHTPEEVAGWLGLEISKTIQIECDSTSSLSSTESCHESPESTCGESIG